MESSRSMTAARIDRIRKYPVGARFSHHMNLDLAYIHAPKNRVTGIIWQKGFRPWKKGETNGACDKRNDINKRISYKKIEIIS